MKAVIAVALLIGLMQMPYQSAEPLWFDQIIDIGPYGRPA